MRNKFFFSLLLCAGCYMGTAAQELQARITVNATRVSSKVNRKIFQTLQSSLTNFLNNRKWTNETFQQNEKIDCSFLLIINQADDDNQYTATLTVQAARPVYNTSYKSPLINFMDESVAFRYVEFQPIEFNENRVAGTDALASNLTATLAYYVYVILGLDFDSFSPRGGDPYYRKAMAIVNNAPESRDIAGWRAFDGLRNRYWLAENLTNSRYTGLHDVIYNYYRKGLDFLYDDEKAARSSVVDALNILNTLNTEFPNTMFIQFFFQGKSDEFVNVFKKAAPDEKQRARDLLMKLDIANINTYKQELK